MNEVQKYTHLEQKRPHKYHHLPIFCRSTENLPTLDTGNDVFCHWAHEAEKCFGYVHMLPDWIILLMLLVSMAAKNGLKTGPQLSID
jgi:hypothetical protein